MQFIGRIGGRQEITRVFTMAYQNLSSILWDENGLCVKEKAGPLSRTIFLGKSRGFDSTKGYDREHHVESARLRQSIMWPPRQKETSPWQSHHSQET